MQALRARDAQDIKRLHGFIGKQVWSKCMGLMSWSGWLWLDNVLVLSLGNVGYSQMNKTANTIPFSTDSNEQTDFPPLFISQLV